MSRALLSTAILWLCVLALAGCREDPGDPNRQLLDDWENPEGFFPEAVEGPDPFVEGEQRFNVGLFYEGGFSEIALLDGTTSNYFIFEAFPGGPLTYSGLIDDQDKVEGVFSDRIVHAGLTFWGGGVFWSGPRDLSRWTLMHVSLKSSDEAFAEIDLGLESNGTQIFLKATDYGYTNDGQWHHLVIELDDFVAAGANLTQLTSPFLFTGGAGEAGEYFKIDAVYWTAE